MSLERDAQGRLPRGRVSRGRLWSLDDLHAALRLQPRARDSRLAPDRAATSPRRSTGEYRFDADGGGDAAHLRPRGGTLRTDSRVHRVARRLPHPDPGAARTQGAGRSAPMSDVAIGIDVGGTKALALMVARDGRVIAEMKLPDAPRRGSGRGRGHRQSTRRAGQRTVRPTVDSTRPKCPSGSGSRA